MSSFPFLSLPRELREQVYDLVFEVPPSSRLYDPGTRYTKATAPLLYVHETITNELQPRLYKDHAIVLPIQEPVTFLRKGKPVALRLKKLPRLMTSRTTMIIVEVIHTQPVRDVSRFANVVTMSYDEDEDEEGNGDEHSADSIWGDIKAYEEEVDIVWEGSDDDSQELWEDISSDDDFEDDETLGIRAITRLTRELLTLKPRLPSTTKIKMIQWSSDWDYTSREIDNWVSQLTWLVDQWDGIEVELQFNIFEFGEGFSGAGYNWAQEWHFRFQQSPNPRVCLSTFGLASEDLEKDEYTGRKFKPTGQMEENWHAMSTQERESTLYTGLQAECRPSFIKVWPMA